MQLGLPDGPGVARGVRRPCAGVRTGSASPRRVLPAQRPGQGPSVRSTPPPCRHSQRGPGPAAAATASTPFAGPGLPDAPRAAARAVFTRKACATLFARLNPRPPRAAGASATRPRLPGRPLCGPHHGVTRGSRTPSCVSRTPTRPAGLRRDRALRAPWAARPLLARLSPVPPTPLPPGKCRQPHQPLGPPPLVTPPTPAPQNESVFTFIARFTRVLPSVGPEPDPRPTRVRVRACIRVRAFLLIVSLFLQKVAFLARLRPGRPARVGASRGLQPVPVQYVGEAGAASAVRWLGRNGGRGAWPRAWVERPGWRSLRWPRGAVAAVTRCAPREGRGPTAAPGQAGSRGHVPPIKTPFTSAAVKLYSDFSTHGVNSNHAFFSVAAKAATAVRPSAAGQVLGARPRRGALQELGIQAGLGIKLPARGPDWGAIRPPSVGPGPQQPPAAGMPPLRPLPEPSLPQSSLGRSPVWVDSVACGL